MWQPQTDLPAPLSAHGGAPSHFTGSVLQVQLSGLTLRISGCTVWMHARICVCDFMHAVRRLIACILLQTCCWRSWPWTRQVQRVSMRTGAKVQLTERWRHKNELFICWLSPIQNVKTIQIMLHLHNLHLSIMTEWIIDTPLYFGCVSTGAGCRL